ncbi:PIN domain-containing protein [Candidatus Leptofilum sp.]|uniref:PIN domain-containing protein n=1 Tax=Candidatus Leptofilum sp. TaxID=3241576 RepID=UPI003B5943A5
MSRAYVDANVILRFLLDDPPEMAAAAAQLFETAADTDLSLIVDDATVAELVWVLKSFYKQDIGTIAAVLRDFFLQDGVELTDKSTILYALTLYETKNVDFIDALLAARMQKVGIEHVYSFDKHFDRLPNIKRLLPTVSPNT